MLIGMGTMILLVPLQAMSSFQMMVPSLGPVDASLWLHFHLQKVNTLDFQMQGSILHGSDPSLKKLVIRKNHQLNCDVTIEQPLFLPRIPNSVLVPSIFSESIIMYVMVLLQLEKLSYCGILRMRWLLTSSQNHFLMTSTTSFVMQWDYGRGRVGVSKTDIHQPPAHRPSSRTVIVST